MIKEYPEVNEEWNQIHPHDLWVYNKLFLSRLLGYTCGPAGSSVPKADFYIVRPSLNLMGMGRFARKMYLSPENSEFHGEHNMHPSEFWCEIFHGDHLSVDFFEKKTKLVVLGERNPEDPYYKWKKWQKIDKNIDFPPILNELKGNYTWINCEFIGNHLIEVHFRRNPDFKYENTVAIPIWRNDTIVNSDGYKIIESKDYYRKGFLVN